MFRVTIVKLFVSVFKINTVIVSLVDQVNLTKLWLKISPFL